MRMDPKKFNSMRSQSSKIPVRGDVFMVDDGARVRPAVIADAAGAKFKVLFCTPRETSGIGTMEIQDTTSAGFDGITYVVKEIKAVDRSDVRSFRGRLSASDLKRLNIPAIMQHANGKVFED